MMRYFQVGMLTAVVGNVFSIPLGSVVRAFDEKVMTVEGRPGLLLLYAAIVMIAAVLVWGFKARLPDGATTAGRRVYCRVGIGLFLLLSLSAYWPALNGGQAVESVAGRLCFAAGMLPAAFLLQWLSARRWLVKGRRTHG